MIEDSGRWLDQCVDTGEGFSGKGLGDSRARIVPLIMHFQVDVVKTLLNAYENLGNFCIFEK